MEQSVAHRVSELSEEGLAVENCELATRARSLEADVDSYRTLAQEALGHVSALTRRNDRLSEQNRALQNEIVDLQSELRWLRGVVMDMDKDRAA